MSTPTARPWSFILRSLRSFRAQLLLLALVSLAPFATFSTLSVRDLSTRYRAESLNLAAEQARTISARLDHFIEGSEQVLDAIGVMLSADPKADIDNKKKLQALKGQTATLYP